MKSWNDKRERKKKINRETVRVIMSFKIRKIGEVSLYS